MISNLLSKLIPETEALPLVPGMPGYDDTQPSLPWKKADGSDVGVQFSDDSEARFTDEFVDKQLNPSFIQKMLNTLGLNTENIQDVMYNPTAYRDAPGIKDVDFRLVDNISSGADANYNPANRLIKLTRDSFSDGSAMSKVLHELSHNVLYDNKMNPGTGYKDAKNWSELENVDDYVKDPVMAGLIKSMQGSPNKLYKNDPGEITARMVQGLYEDPTLSKEQIYNTDFENVLHIPNKSNIEMQLRYR